jgi:hypothetical protein
MTVVSMLSVNLNRCLRSLLFQKLWSLGLDSVDTGVVREVVVRKDDGLWWLLEGRILNCGHANLGLGSGVRNGLLLGLLDLFLDLLHLFLAQCRTIRLDLDLDVSLECPLLIRQEQGVLIVGLPVHVLLSVGGLSGQVNGDLLFGHCTTNVDLVRGCRLYLDDVLDRGLSCYSSLLLRTELRGHSRLFLLDLYNFIVLTGHPIPLIGRNCDRDDDCN